MSDEAADLQKRRIGWFHIHKWWQRLYWLVVIWTAAGSAIAACGLLSQLDQQIVSLTVTLAATLLATTKPNEQATAYRRAWLRLDQELKKSAGISEAELQALADGESFITAGVRTFSEVDQRRNDDSAEAGT